MSIPVIKNLKNFNFLGSKADNYVFWFYVILALGFAVRIINLNYNSAFNDEAIYVVIGRMGLFTHDWWSYGAKLWMAGLPYIYTPLTAVAYETGGIVASRFLNVILGVILIEEVYRFTKLLKIYDDKTNKFAALISAFLVAFSGIGIFVSKLAAYDMLSFLLLMVGINSFLKSRFFSNGKYYFLAFFCLFMAFLTKIVIAIFFPFLFLLSILIMKQRSSIHKKTSIIYLYAPLVIASVLYLILYRDNLLTYIFTHKDLGLTTSYMDIISLIWQESNILLLLLIPSLFVFLKTKKIKEFAILMLLSLAIPVFHLGLLRFATLDKHVYLSVIFLSVIAGYALSFLVLNKNKIISFFSKAALPIIIFFYLISSAQVLYARENEWKNTQTLQNYLKQKIQPGDKVLTEEGGVIVLALYDKIFPPKSIVTFDWIDYSGLKDRRGYLQAVNDVYFDYIQIDNKNGDEGSLKSDIRKNLAPNYKLSYSKDNFEVYEKIDK